VSVLRGQTSTIKQLQLTSHISRKLGKAPKLVPVAAVDLNDFVWLLLVVLIAQICLDVLSKTVLLSTLDHWTSDGRCLSN